jgi:Tfp pilus assembly protein PilF
VNRPLRNLTLAVLAVLCLVPVMSAQTRVHSPTPSGPTSPTGLSEPAVVGSSIIVAVVDEAGMPIDKQAIVKLFDDATQSVTWGSTQGRTEAQFDNVKAGDYEIEVSAPGFKTTREELNASSSHEAYRVLVALPLDIGGAETGTKPGQVLAPKARKEVDSGMAALKDGKLAEAQKHLEAAYKLAPGNADVNYLLGVLWVQERNLRRAQTYLNQAISLDSRHVGALTELGHVLLLQRDFGGAIAVLEPAVLLDAKQWRGHWFLADAYLEQQKFEKACQQASLAIQEGRGAAAEARLILAEGLAGLGRTTEAIQSLETFVQDDPKSEGVPRAKALIAKLQAVPGIPPAER